MKARSRPTPAGASVRSIFGIAWCPETNQSSATNALGSNNCSTAAAWCASGSLRPVAATT